MSNSSEEEKEPLFDSERLAVDNCAFAKGCFFGTIMAIPFWIVIFAGVKILLKH